ncbi:hypothetical protein EDD18DRAFT_1099090 [Armillaria luteobubalina]|uniref:Uncharacterized protein n=1 Tax=Armillaria luteobubalina TaxID=153913 RepID=A0AA39QL08_9AGAR|nr:hypothetical protein EDD18DRAFT_1099090 [Armillaria luteobubalina]
MKKSANIIFEGIVPITAFTNGHDQSTGQLCLTLLGYDSIRQRYAQCPELLFPPGQGCKQGPALFWSPTLVKVLSHILLGPSSLTTGKKTQLTNAVLWEKTAITPGAIAYAAVIIRESTKIPYAADCWFYIRTIEAMLSFSSTKRTLEFFNKNLFFPKRNMRGLAIASLQEASDEEEEAIVRGLYETEVDRETEVASLEEDTAANATFLAPQLTLRAPTITVGASLTSNYVDIGSDDDNDNNDNISDISDIDEDEDEDEIMANSTPPNTPMESITVTAETARLQELATCAKTVTFMLPGIDTQAAEPVENEAAGSMAVQEALNGGRMVIHNGTQGSMGTCGGTWGRGGKWGSKCQEGKKKATEKLCPRQRRANRKSVPIAKALSTLKDLYCMKSLALERYKNINEVPSAELSLLTNLGVNPSPALPPHFNSLSASPSSPGATTSQRCWEQAQPLATGLSEDSDDMGDALPFPPEMASSSEPEPPMDYICMEYHPHSGRQPRLNKVEEFQAQIGSRSTITSEDKPWSPFSSRDDFELTEWILESTINQGDIDALLMMMIKQGGQANPTNSLYTIEIYGLGRWIYFKILSSLLISTGMLNDCSKSTATTLPNGRKPICYIIYADKMRLSSFGTVQGYPIIVRLGNLPSHIRNSQGIGGGHVIGWLPIVKEEAQHTEKSYYADFKRAIWHKAFEFILSPIKEKSKFGAWVQVAGAAELYLFPTIMILSADYEEQCMMALTQGCNTYFPCNICMVPFEKQYHVNETYKLRTLAKVQQIYEEAKKIRGATACNTFLQKFSLCFIKNTFWDIMHCDIYRALSFDRLHVFNNGLFADHLLKEIKKRMIKLGSSYAQLADKLLQAFPSWKDLYHFKQGFMNMTFTDGQKYEALSKRMILLDGWARTPIFASVIERTLTRTDTILKEKKLKHWNFLKAHSHQHLFNDIKAKGVTLNYNTKPNESMHGSFKESYQHHTNFKNVDEQILQVDDWYNTMTYIRQQVNHHDKIEKEGDEDDEGKTGDSNKDELAPMSSTSSEADYAATTSLHEGHGKGGELPSDNGVPAEFDGFKCQDQILLYGMIKVNYSSVVDWSFTTDILQCLPSFNYHPRYDFVLLDTNQGPMFVQLVLIFECIIHEKVYPLMLVWLFKEA